MFVDPISFDLPYEVRTEIAVSLTVSGECLVEEDRPLRKKVHPSQFSASELDAIGYDFQSSRWVFLDGEPDDFADIFLLPKAKGLFITESHPVRGEVFKRTQTFMEKLGEPEKRLLAGNGISVERLIEELRALPDHSLSIQVIANSPTLAAVIRKEPMLLAQKLKRIVNYGGFAHRKCETGRFQGETVYYTTFNYNMDLDAAQTLFDFTENERIPLYILAADNLRFPRSIYFDLPNKLRAIDTPATRYIGKEIENWNRVHHLGTILDNIQKEAVNAGYKPEDALSCEMTPADTIAGVLDLALDELEIHSRGFSHIQITDEPRYEKRGGSFIPKEARAVLLEEDPDSTIRYVDGFHLKGYETTTSDSFQFLINHLLNIRWHEQWLNPPQQTQNSSLARRFFSLQGELTELQLEEAKKGLFDYAKRVSFFEQLTALQIELNKRLSEIEEGSGPFSSLSPVERKELFAFAAYGRGAESVRIFSKEWIDLPFDHPTYGDLLMEYAHDSSRFLDERHALQKELFEKAQVELVSFSDRLALLYPDQENITVFMRGMIGSGKTSLLASQLGFGEPFTSSDRIKLYLGGILSHHESVAMSDNLIDLSLPNKVDMRTNIRDWNNEIILQPKEEASHIVLDIAISKEIVEQRLAQRAEKGGRKPSAAEIEEGLFLSQKNRLPILQAALENSQIEWHLYDNNGPTPTLIASITNQTLQIHNSTLWANLFQSDVQ